MTYKDKRTVQSYVDKEVYDAIEQAAKKDDRTVAAFVRQILNSWYKNNTNNKDS